MIGDKTLEMDQEARLNAICAGIAPFSAEMAPDRHCLLTLGWRGAGAFEARPCGMPSPVPSGIA